MLNYILKRILLMIPTLMGIMLINFIIIQAAPGGPIQQVISKLKGNDSDIDNRFGAQDAGMDHQISDQSGYRGIQGIDPAFIKELEKRFGFDKPAHERFFLMMKNYATFNFGKSYFRDEEVITIIKSKLPVSISLGFWTTLIVYLISIPLGIRKAVYDGSAFDVSTSTIIIVAYAIPSFLFALFLIVMFAGGTFWNIFPLRGLHSDNFQTLSFFGKIKDYAWHIFLPIVAMVMSGFAKLTLLTKNSFLEEINKLYVLTARSKGLPYHKVLYHHVFRNAMLVIIAGFPTAFVHILFTSSLLIEVLFSLDGLGLLGFESALQRDYPLMFGTLYMFTLLSLVLHLIGDLCYMAVDRRIDLSASRA
ncbi:MAG: microcin C ABC transporter permease YejB [Alphaproteobacteria bacterium]|nr:microcin C ABC transporter permease YejB [Alphaproteobacteria bacterium]